MRHKSAKPVFCRWCGKPIAKSPIVINVRQEPTKYDHPSETNQYLYVGKDVTLRSKADCKRHTNQTILSVRYWGNPQDNDGEYIYSFNVWDGESYANPFFCSGTCAQSMGIAAATKNWSTKAWRTAMLSVPNGEEAA